VRSCGDIALIVASSSIVALLLLGGRTAHSYLKIPIALDRKSFCYIRKQDDLTTLIHQTKSSFGMKLLWLISSLLKRWSELCMTLQTGTNPLVALFSSCQGTFTKSFRSSPRDPVQTLSLHQSKTPTYGNLLRYSVFRKICRPMMLLQFTPILGIALLHTSFFVLATTS
jgi:hypothetical protein